MRILAAVLFVVAPALVIPAAASAEAGCQLMLRPPDGVAAPIDHIDALPVGVTRGRFECGAVAMPLALLAMEVDGDAASLGVRDLPVIPRERIGRWFHPDGSVPFGAGSAHQFRRDYGPGPVEPTRNNRRLAALCGPGVSSPDEALDCWTGGRRIKVRVDSRDLDGDGALDADRHEISIYDGRDRLYIFMLNSPHVGGLDGAAALWARLLRAIAVTPGA